MIYGIHMVYGIYALTAAFFTYIHLVQARRSLHRYWRTRPGMWTRHHLSLFLLSVCCVLGLSLLTLYDAFLAVGLF